jgi:hypothetical protein
LDIGGRLEFIRTNCDASLLLDPSAAVNVDVTAKRDKSSRFISVLNIFSIEILSKMRDVSIAVYASQHIYSNGDLSHFEC